MNVQLVATSVGKYFPPVLGIVSSCFYGMKKCDEDVMKTKTDMLFATVSWIEQLASKIVLQLASGENSLPQADPRPFYNR